MSQVEQEFASNCQNGSECVDLWATDRCAKVTSDYCQGLSIFPNDQRRFKHQLLVPELR